MEHDFDHEIHELLSFEAIKDSYWEDSDYEIQEDCLLLNDLMARARQHGIVIPTEVTELCDQSDDIEQANLDTFWMLFDPSTIYELSQATINWLKDLPIHTAIAQSMNPEAAIQHLTEQRHLTVYNLVALIDDPEHVTRIVVTTNDYLAAHFPELPLAPLEPDEVYEQRQVQRDFIRYCEDVEERNQKIYHSCIGIWREKCRDILGEHDDIKSIELAIKFAFEQGLRTALHTDWSEHGIPPASMLANLESLDEYEKVRFIDYMTGFILGYTLEDFEQNLVPWELDEALVAELAHHWVMLHGYMMSEKGYIP